MTRNITRRPRIPILQPRPTDIRVLLVDHVVYVLQEPLNMVRVHDPCNAGANAQDLDLAGVWAMEHDVWDGVLCTGDAVVGIAVGGVCGEGVVVDGVDVGSHCWRNQVIDVLGRWWWQGAKVDVAQEQDEVKI